MLELELKARVADPDAVDRALTGAGAKLHFAGRMHDLRFDNVAGSLRSGDEVLRVRRWVPDSGAAYEEVGWKGPTHTVAGYKARHEREARLAEGAAVVPILEALGYRVIARIDRWVRLWHHAGAALRIEWYPEMDTLIEVEGDGPAIEQVIAITAIPRTEFSTSSLPGFAAAYAKRTGRPARLALAEPTEHPGHWPR